MPRVLAAVGVLVVLALVAAEGATACSCVPADPKGLLADSDGAVVARLLKVKPLDEVGSKADFVYRTGRVVKGRRRGLRRGRRLVVRSALQSAACGLSKRVGALTGLFLIRDRDRWHSNLCLEVSAAQMRALAPKSRRATAAPPCS